MQYGQIFEDWEASIVRQSTVLAGILDRECGNRRPIRVLDCACGIAYEKLRVGGSFIGSIRDYDRAVVERPTTQGPSFFSDSGRRRIVFQIWDWLDERHYRVHHPKHRISMAHVPFHLDLSCGASE
jgi:hypothetical protein